MDTHTHTSLPPVGVSFKGKSLLREQCLYMDESTVFRSSKEAGWRGGGGGGGGKYDIKDSLSIWRPSGGFCNFHLKHALLTFNPHISPIYREGRHEQVQS